MKRDEKGDRTTKSLNDNLTPIKNFLRGSVGRRWDDIWAEVCAVNDKRNIKGYHLRDHVEGYVSTYEEWLNRPRYRHLDFIIGLDGILYDGGQWHAPSYYVPPKGPEPVKVSERLELHRVDGIWYAIELAPVSEIAGPHDEIAHAWDVIEKNPVYFERGLPTQSDSIERTIYGPTRDRISGALYPDRHLYAKTKRQLNTKELIKHGLKLSNHPVRTLRQPKRASNGANRMNRPFTRSVGQSQLTYQRC